MFFYKITNKLLDLIAPIECVSCSCNNFWLCPKCQTNLQQKPIIIENYNENIKKVICAFEYKNNYVQKLIHVGKYDGVCEPIKILANFLSLCLQQNLPNDNYIFIPVPLHPKRERERGFNQSQIIADVLHKTIKGEIIDGNRIINTPHQVGLNGQQRQKNMSNVFTFNTTDDFKNSTAIIVDDVITTGATITSLAKVIGPFFRNVYAVAIAKE